MESAQQNPAGTLHWRLSSHPITLLCFLGFRLGTHFSLPKLLGNANARSESSHLLIWHAIL